MWNPEDIREYQAPTDLLKGRVIAITGAGTGLGRAVAFSAAQRGAQVVLIGRNLKQLELVHTAIAQQRGVMALIAPLDLERALAKDYDTLAGAVLERFGRLDGLLHSAAQLGQLAPIEHYDMLSWCRVLHVNLTAAFALTQVLLPALRASPDASVIFTSSGVGRRGRANWGAYAVSKFGVEGLTQVLADEMSGTTTVRVNAINPGAARTTLRRQAYPGENADALPEPDSLVNSYLWLLGGDSRGITGQSLDCQAPTPPDSGASPTLRR